MPRVAPRLGIRRWLRRPPSLRPAIGLAAQPQTWPGFQLPAYPPAQTWPRTESEVPPRLFSSPPSGRSSPHPLSSEPQYRIGCFLPSLLWQPRGLPRLRPRSEFALLSRPAASPRPWLLPLFPPLLEAPPALWSSSPPRPWFRLSRSPAPEPQVFSRPLKRLCEDSRRAPGPQRPPVPRPVHVVQSRYSFGPASGPDAQLLTWLRLQPSALLQAQIWFPSRPGASLPARHLPWQLRPRFSLSRPSQRQASPQSWPAHGLLARPASELEVWPLFRLPLLPQRGLFLAPGTELPADLVRSLQPEASALAPTRPSRQPESWRLPGLSPSLRIQR